VPDNGLTIKKGWEFDLIFRTGLRIQGELVRLLFLRGSGAPSRLCARAGYAVGKRQGRAHVRNRGRRILREAFRRLRPWVVPDVDLVLSLRDRALGAGAVEIYRDMAKLLGRNGLFVTDWPGADWNRVGRTSGNEK
jgi:ribonuclease P protein component